MCDRVLAMLGLLLVSLTVSAGAPSDQTKLSTEQERAATQERTEARVLDAGPELSALDAGPELSALDAGSELSALDAGPELSALDARPELSALDAGPELSALDAGPELSALDAGSELSALDAGPELSALDARPELSAIDSTSSDPVPPPSPDLLVEPGRNRLTLRWTDRAEAFVDPKSGVRDFEGYRIYVSEEGREGESRLLVEADIVDSLFYDTGLDGFVEETAIGGIDYKYRYDITGLRDGFQYWIAITAFDTGSPDVLSVESELAQNRTLAIPGTSASPASGPEVVVFPNPYRGDAVWDGVSRRDRFLWFANLPGRCTIRIYTLSGDLVDTIEFDQSYAPTDIRGIYDPTDPADSQPDLPRLSGGMAAWDLVSRNGEAIATGLYMFSVEDLETGGKQLGKFLVMK